MENQALTPAQQKADATMREVCLLLNWTDMQYNEFLYQNGIAYLHLYLPCDEWGRQQLERSRLFWNWFKLLWISLDKDLLNDALFTKLPCEKRRNDYRFMHCPRTLVYHVKPNAVVLQSLKKSDLCKQL